MKKSRKLEILRVEIAKIDTKADDSLSDDGDDLTLMTFMDALYRCEDEDESEIQVFHHR